MQRRLGGAPAFLDRARVIGILVQPPPLKAAESTRISCEGRTRLAMRQ